MPAHSRASGRFTTGAHTGLVMTNRYDQYLRRTNLTLRNGTTTLAATGYGYDTASRLQSVSDSTNTATYTYLDNSSLVGQIVFTRSGTTRMTTTKQYDYLNRLTAISSVPSGASTVSNIYGLNSANQRTRSTLADGSYWVYGYDSLGQVTSGKRYWSDGTAVAGQQFEYTFDDIGNRKTTGTGGDASGTGLRPASYYVNALNQYTSRSVTGAVEVLGMSYATNTVTVNGQATYRKGEYFWKELNYNNSSTALWSNIVVAATGQSSVTGYVFIAKTPEVFSYDADGNLTNDGRWGYAWDAENRLVSMAANTAVGPQQYLKFEYDSKGRRIRKQVWPNTTGSGNPTNDVKFAYDGWNLVSEVDAANSTIRSYTWGLDLSGSLQGAGGVGGLLVVNDATNGVHFVPFDGNGNVSALVQATDGALSGQYEYGPFGEVIRTTGTMGKVNPFTFGTYFCDWETDKCYAKNRYYDPSTARWLSRDPVGESGFNVIAGNEDGAGIAAPDNNLYALAANNPISQVDPLGLAFYAIDGTLQTERDRTNPWKLYNRTKEDPKRYYRGTRRGLSGVDMFIIARKVRRQICSDYCAVGGKDFRVNLTGWSRGAVAAVWVAVLLNEVGCDCGCGTKRPIPVNWMGLFDAVNMAWVEPPPASVPPNVAHFYHAVKTRTDQWYFPTFHFGGGTEQKIYNYRAPILSSHSDVGTSDTATETHINGAENWIQDTAVASGVKF